MNDEIICPVCNGTGYEKYKHMNSGGEMVEESVTCNYCQGTGYIQEVICKNNDDELSGF